MAGRDEVRGREAGGDGTDVDSNDGDPYNGSPTRDETRARTHTHVNTHPLIHLRTHTDTLTPIHVDSHMYTHTTLSQTRVLTNTHTLEKE